MKQYLVSENDVEGFLYWDQTIPEYDVPDLLDAMGCEPLPPGAKVLTREEVGVLLRTMGGYHGPYHAAGERILDQLFGEVNDGEG